MNKNLLPYFILAILLYLGHFSFAQNPIPYGDNKEAGKYIVLNGVKHYYEVYGTGKPLLLIHGNATGIKGFAPQIPYFAQKYSVFAVDCRGRGKSDLGNDSLSYLQTANDMAAFIRLLKLDSVMVVGKSDGGIIGILMGIYFPEHLAKIVAFGANMSPDSTALYPQVVADAHNERVNAEKMLAAKDTSKNWKLIRLRNRMMEFQPNVKAEDLHKIKVPVLVMSSDRDVIREEHTFFIYKNIPRANLCIFSDETHYVPRQNPDLFNATIDKFLSQPFKGQEARFAK
jgi:pimeloyl-ACP methyl ester carboxylesterase